MIYQQEPITIRAAQLLRVFKGTNKDSAVTLNDKYKVEVPYLMVSAL